MLELQQPPKGTLHLCGEKRFRGYRKAVTIQRKLRLRKTYPSQWVINFSPVKKLEKIYLECENRKVREIAEKRIKELERVK